MYVCMHARACVGVYMYASMPLIFLSLSYVVINFVFSYEL